MKTFSKLAVAAIALMGASIGASGSAMALDVPPPPPPPPPSLPSLTSTTSLGQLTIGDGHTYNPSFANGFTFADAYTFTLATPSQFGGALTNQNANYLLSVIAASGGGGPNTQVPDLQITGLNESLWANGVLVAGNLQDTTTISLNGNTQANYTLVVQGTASGAQGGAYIMGYSVAAVPIPGAAVLFGSGLVAFAGLGRRAVKVQA